MSNKDKIWIYHHCLSHSSFSVLKVNFPLLFKEMSVKHLHCVVCELAKHKHAYFQISNKRTNVCFSVIHSDIWGPSTISNIFGAHWFVSFIDDCTWVTWLYLLKKQIRVEFIDVCTLQLLVFVFLLFSFTLVGGCLMLLLYFLFLSIYLFVVSYKKKMVKN